jgi:hypothetical protein
MPTACFKQAFMKVALDRPRKFSRSKQSRSNVLPKYASARRFFARLASEIFLTSLQTDLFNNLPE